MPFANKSSYQIQKLIVIFTIIVLALKWLAFYYTHSIAILTDALEFIVNIIAGIITLISLRIALRPKDANHPYGHGKIEFIAAAIEGTLMLASSLIIFYEAIPHLFKTHQVHQLNKGLILLLFTAIANFIIGHFAVVKGKQLNSLALQATGIHLKMDTYATLAVIGGLVLLLFIPWPFIDALMAIILAIILAYQGYKIIKESLSGIMDAADEKLLQKFVAFASNCRRPAWVDMHNVRIIKYGSTLHVDCHFTVPWYFNVHEAHSEIDIFTDSVKEVFGEAIELFIHTDGCLPMQCKICTMPNCVERQHAFENKIDWTIENISSNVKHGL
jgi:cation diffusion facilitator family transporter